MSDKLYLGIDGGGTKTAFALMNSDLKIISYKEVGPSSLDTVSFETLKKVLEEGTKDITQTVDSIFLGLGGIYSKEQEMKVCELTKELNIVAPHTKIDASNDVINALYGALGGKDGIVLIAGTGSVCYGKNNGKTFRVGGYCYKEGDLGSAYDLGYKALQYLAKVIDKREEETSFSKRLKETINCYTYEDLQLLLKQEHVTPVVTADLKKMYCEIEKISSSKSVYTGQGKVQGIRSAWYACWNPDR